LPQGESSATSSPFLLISKNALSQWVDPATQQTLLVTPNGPGVIALAGRWIDAEGRVVELTDFRDALLRAPPGPVPFMPDVAPIPYHTYFGQWVFLRGQHPVFPGDFPAGVEYFTSRPFRLSVANPD
jgi:hypothetical protein